MLDDFSRYILAWQLSDTMAADDVKRTLDSAREQAGITGCIIERYHRAMMQVVKLDIYFFPRQL